MARSAHSTSRGSALVAAMFVLVLLATMGIGLLFLSDNEGRLGKSSLASKQVYYLSEGGLENGRADLYNINKVSADPQNLTEELEAAAGPDGSLDFDPAAVAPTFDANGNVTGFTGYGDDVPLTPLTPMADGWFATFVNNDPVEGLDETADADQRVMLTSIAVRRDGSSEMTQAMIQRRDTFAVPPATITILGPTPTFNGGKSNAKYYTGNDYGSHCPPGTGDERPVVGVLGPAAEALAETGVVKPANYVEGTESGVDTVDDLTLDPGLPELWTDCSQMLELADLVRQEADVVGNASTPLSDFGTPADPKVVFIVGDYDISGSFNGGGLLWVTGTLTMDGQASWEGPIWVVGRGYFDRDGAGTGTIAGGVIVANISGPDQVLFTSDDCSGPDGVVGTADDGVAASTYVVSGSGNGTTGYCSAYFHRWQGLRPFDIMSFRQR